MNRTYLAWLIDLDGTLYRPPLIKALMGLEVVLLGPHRFKVLRAFRKAHEELRHEQGTDPMLSFAPSPLGEQLRRAAAKTGMSSEQLANITEQWMIHRPGKWLRLALRKDLIKQIRDFRAQGGKTALVSDYPAQFKLSAMGLTELFDVVVANGETEGLTRLKPAPDGYLLAAQKLGTAPKDCLVIGDRKDADGQAAESAGIDFRLV